MQVTGFWNMWIAVKSIAEIEEFVEYTFDKIYEVWSDKM